MRERSTKKKKILIAVVAYVMAFLGCVLLFCGIAESVVDNTARVLPSYEKEDLWPTLLKSEWAEEDYAFLYRQTGLGRLALDALKEDPSRIEKIQESFFYEGELRHELAAFSSPHDYLYGYKAEMAPMEDGDVLVTSSCHTFGWRNGHAAIVVDGKNGRVVESNNPGHPSAYGPTEWFANSSNFILLRLKGATQEERAQIARYAERNLINIPYSLIVGIFTSKDLKDNITQTNCSHLVWQAYKHFGYDIDADGGPVCTSRDISLSPLFEVVQVYGFDPYQLW